MKSCLCCGAKVASDMHSCAKCGESSWHAVPIASPEETIPTPEHVASEENAPIVDPDAAPEIPVRRRRPR